MPSPVHPFPVLPVPCPNASAVQLEIQVTFPKERQLQQSRYPTLINYKVCCSHPPPWEELVKKAYTWQVKQDVTAYLAYQTGCSGQESLPGKSNRM